ncbi:unnamed protein product [Blepharisma stoltei]|uniref:Uncharacterized protein n=1 Tax=Blepharisma stoltei TaxID=1481888 RepID=A0AAU9INE3_9CILI|nr:unnamed protein product [Blepharisma stoltei]
MDKENLNSAKIGSQAFKPTAAFSNKNSPIKAQASSTNAILLAQNQNIPKTFEPKSDQKMTSLLESASKEGSYTSFCYELSPDDDKTIMSSEDSIVQNLNISDETNHSFSQINFKDTKISVLTRKLALAEASLKEFQSALTDAHIECDNYVEKFNLVNADKEALEINLAAAIEERDYHKERSESLYQELMKVKTSLEIREKLFKMQEKELKKKENLAAEVIKETQKNEKENSEFTEDIYNELIAREYMKIEEIRAELEKEKIKNELVKNEIKKEKKDLEKKLQKNAMFEYKKIQNVFLVLIFAIVITFLLTIILK